MKNKIALLRLCGRSLPLPGRFLDTAIRQFGIDLSKVPTPVTCKDRNGDFFIEIQDIKDIVQKHIFFQGYFEYRESAFVKKSLNNGDIFVDIGANIGWHSLIAAKSVGPEGHVLAYEPVSSTFGHLNRNIEINGFNNVTIYNFGLGSNAGNFEMYEVDTNNSGANSLHTGASSTAIETVRIERGDDSLEMLRDRCIDLCKIDVEGAEMSVLMGLSATFKRRGIKKLMIEINEEALKRAGAGSRDVVEFLKDNDFELFGLRNRGAKLDMTNIHEEPNVICILREGSNEC